MLNLIALIFISLVIVTGAMTISCIIISTIDELFVKDAAYVKLTEFIKRYIFSIIGVLFCMYIWVISFNMLYGLYIQLGFG